MAVQEQSIPIDFGGVITKGSPLDRPASSAVRSVNLRLMPGATSERKLYLRLRGGKKVQYTDVVSGAGFRQFFEFRKTTVASPRYPVCQRYTGSAWKWSALDLSASPYTLGDMLTISESYGWVNTAYAAISAVRDKLMMYNGLGVRDGTDSKSPFTTWDGTTLRYCGLDAYCVGGNPTAAFAAGAGNNTIADLGDSTGVSIYVGLHNTATQHFSNAVFAGRLTTDGTGTITVSNLDRLKSAYLNATEQGELKFVFYATIDGGAVAYLILNSGLTGPLTSAISNTSQSLSVTAIHPQGFVLDNTQERPNENYPPRPMSKIAYANGRVYGVLLGGGSGTSGFLKDQPAPGSDESNYYRDFQFPLTNQKDIGAIVWSASADSGQGNDFVGVPEESFPLRNRKYPPNGEFPLMIDATPGGAQLLVITSTGTFILSEAADGLHEWTTVSDIDGCLGERSYVRTPRGPMWITQEKQLVLLDKDTFRLVFLSPEFDELLSSTDYFALASACDYLRRPNNYVDCYKVFRVSSTFALVYDFAAGGKAYEEDSVDTSAAGTLRDVFGNLHHIQASGKRLYSQEVDPFTGTCPVRDELTTGVYTEVSGYYITQWMMRGDGLERLRLTDIDIVGDGAVSAQLSGSPLTVTYYLDLSEDGNKTPTIEKAKQSLTNMAYKARTRDANPFWVKLRFDLTGHSTDADSALFYPNAASRTGELTPTVQGCIYSASVALQQTGNRP